jgi:pyruvate,water dikinase
MTKKKDLDWKSDVEHFPYPLKPMAIEYIRKCQIPALNYRYKYLNVPKQMHIKEANGLIYFATSIIDNKASADNIELLEANARRKLAIAAPVYWERTVLPNLSKMFEEMDRTLATMENVATALTAWQTCWRHSLRAWKMHFLLTGGVNQGLKDFVHFCQNIKLGLTDEEIYCLTINRSTEISRIQADLSDLINIINRLPGVELLINTDDKINVEKIKLCDPGELFLHKFSEFLKKHGHMGQLYDDLELQSWGENPDLLWVQLRILIRDKKQNKSISRNPESLLQAIYSNGSIPSEEFQHQLKLAQQLRPLVDEHAYWLDRGIQARVHKCICQMGQTLSNVNLLASQSDIFFLKINEVTRIIKSGNAAESIVSMRKKKYEQACKYYKEKSYALPNSIKYNNADKVECVNHLKGRSITDKIIRGRACIIRSNSDFFKMKTGQILICPSANASWFPLFKLASAIITDSGGISSHGALLAMEMNLPGIVGVKDATNIIQDNQYVEINGPNNLVIIYPS